MDQFAGALGTGRGGYRHGPSTETVTVNLTRTPTLLLSAPEVRVGLVVLAAAKSWQALARAVDGVAAAVGCDREVGACYAALVDDQRRFVMVLEDAHACALRAACETLAGGGVVRLPGGVPQPSREEIALIGPLAAKVAEAIGTARDS